VRIDGGTGADAPALPGATPSRGGPSPAGATNRPARCGAGAATAKTCIRGVNFTAKLSLTC
jgi:hypothetical protein